MAEGARQLRPAHRGRLDAGRGQELALRQGRRLDPPRRPEVPHRHDVVIVFFAHPYPFLFWREGGCFRHLFFVRIGMSLSFAEKVVVFKWKSVSCSGILLLVMLLGCLFILNG